MHWGHFVCLLKEIYFECFNRYFEKSFINQLSWPSYINITDNVEVEEMVLSKNCCNLQVMGRIAKLGQWCLSRKMSGLKWTGYLTFQKKEEIHSNIFNKIWKRKYPCYKVKSENKSYETFAIFFHFSS